MSTKAERILARQAACDLALVELLRRQGERGLDAGWLRDLGQPYSPQEVTASLRRLIGQSLIKYHSRSKRYTYVTPPGLVKWRRRRA